MISIILLFLWIEEKRYGDHIHIFFGTSNKKGAYWSHYCTTTVTEGCKEGYEKNSLHNHQH